ncbi:DUF1801 domain-containing protein [Brevundimonas pishanensis]|uniref:DUF1801 domain-containing protein n=1 Tax=Brevundimonas pishanensis TaxID=2896315 RepID=UPI001FA6B765|nr:DUF1801 domain-containing protein [Brevundimonas pishanensis]
MTKDVSGFLDSLEEAPRKTVEALRAIVRRAHPDVQEGFKWNAPNFTLKGQDRITLGIMRNGGVRIVRHRGSKPEPMKSFAFDDPDRLMKWPEPDRGVLILKDDADVACVEDKLVLLCSRWLATTT